MTSELLGENADNILVLHLMRQANLLRLRIEFARLAPDQGILEMSCQTSMNPVTDSFNRGTLPQTDGVTQVGLLASLFGVHSGVVSFDEHLRSLLDKPQLLPNCVQKPIETQIFLTTDHHCSSVALTCHAVQCLHRDSVDLVIDSKSWNVFASVQENINELVNCHLESALLYYREVHLHGSSHRNCGLGLDLI